MGVRKPPNQLRLAAMSFRMSANMLADLEALSLRLGKSKTSIVRLALREYIQKKNP